jgi:DNA repair ATPase RecN
VKNVYDYLIERYGQKDYQPNLYMMLEELQEKVKVLEEKYEGALQDIKRLEEENVETTNCLYENANSISAVDARIDILAEHCRITKDV